MVKNQVQLITYPDSLGGNLPRLYTILATHFADIFTGGVHILPPFPSSGDRGFAPLTYFEIDPIHGTWEDIRRIGQNFDILVDLMVNHISRHSEYFQDFLKHGRRSQYADLFITLDKIWPDGHPPTDDVAKIFLRKPEHPFSDVRINDTGEIERIWTSFGVKEWSEQIDLDVHSDRTKTFLKDILTHFHNQRIRQVRLDAVGYVTKKPGTSCFFVEPEIYDFLEWIQKVANSLNITLLPEVHAHYSIQQKLANHGYWVYDFVLPLLILHTLLTKFGGKLQRHLRTCPRHQFTMLDCHDGIPVQPDLDGILTTEESRRIVDRCLQRGGNLNRILPTRGAVLEFDAHQINCTYYAALDYNDDAYLTARAIQFFAPGVPQVYYVGLLAGQNDLNAVQETGEGRAINRHNYTINEVEEALKQPVVQRLLRLIRFRNHHPAFNGQLSIPERDDDHLTLRWTKDVHTCELNVDVQTGRSMINYTDDSDQLTTYVV